MPEDVQFPDDDALLDIVSAAKLDQAAPALHRWYSRDELRGNFRAALTEEVKRVYSGDLAAEFQKYCPVPGVSSSGAYKNRWLALPSGSSIGGYALVGIRFRALDLARPFVAVVATTKPVTRSAQLRQLAVFLQAEFSAFAPKHIQVFVPQGVGLDLSGLPAGSEWDQRFLAAPIGVLRAQPRPLNYGRLALRVPEAGFYARYAKAHERLFALSPEHREYTRTETEEDLLELQKEKTLFEVFVDGAWAGIAAATRSEEQGLRGFVVIEMLLGEAYRGKGFGPTVQRHLLEQVTSRDGDVLYGTVHDQNRAALRSARRLGREEVGAQLWVGLAG